MNAVPDRAVMPDEQGHDNLPIFDARLSPHTAMTPKTFRCFAIGLIGAALLITVPLLTRGYWPVLPFMAGDIAFVLIIMHRHMASRARCQHVRVDRSGVVVTQYDRHQHAVSRQSLPLYGLMLERERDPDYGLRALRLSLRGRVVEVARDLAPAERAEFADAFEQAVNAAGCVLRVREHITHALMRT